MLRTSKKEEIFYDDFLNMISLIHQSAVKLEDLIKNYTNIEDKLAEISKLEHDCDLLAHKSFERINSAFITPLDREDIILIVKSLDDILDYIDETAHLFYMYNVKVVKPESLKFSELITQSVESLKNVISNMHNPKDAKQLKSEIIFVNELENKGDIIYRSEMRKLFLGNSDAIEIITWTGIYNYLEKALDACEDVANIIEGVVMKYA